MKRVLFVTDYHCGSRVGLTPPKWQYKTRNVGVAYAKYAKVQKELWNFYKDTIRELQPVDILIHDGDVIDGKGSRTGGTELITSDRNEQVEMAVHCLSIAKAKEIIILYGTAYHASSEEDWECTIKEKILEKCAEEGAERPNVYIEGHAFPVINGVQFDIKHKIGSSTIPHGRYTAIARDKLWNTIWNNQDEKQPNAGVLIRAHVHYHSYCGTFDWLAMTLPALQGYGSKYGVRECSGVVDIGMVYFDIENDGSYIWHAIEAKLPQQKVRPLKL